MKVDLGKSYLTKGNIIIDIVDYHSGEYAFTGRDRHKGSVYYYRKDGSNSTHESPLDLFVELLNKDIFGTVDYIFKHKNTLKADEIIKLLELSTITVTA